MFEEAFQVITDDVLTSRFVCVRSQDTSRRESDNCFNCMSSLGQSVI